MINRISFISLSINIIFLLLFSVLCVWKRNSIKNRLINMVNKNAGTVSEKVLSKFNQEPYVSNNEYLDKGFKKDIEILFLGNSLTICGVPDEEPDKTKRGLTSTSISKDYVHLLVNEISNTKKVNVKYSILNIADFERNFASVPFDKTQLKNSTVQNPDYVVFQIGENVSKEDITTNGNLFETEYINLVNCFKSSVKIVCLPFWPDKDKINHITDVAIKSNSYLVDLSHLGGGYRQFEFCKVA